MRSNNGNNGCCEKVEGIDKDNIKEDTCDNGRCYDRWW